MTSPTEPAVVELVDAGVPADQGLSSLGLLMQLAGNLFAAVTSVIALSVLILGTRALGDGSGVMLFALIGAGIVRSLVQNYAGRQLLYGEGGGGRLAGVRRYVQIGIVHSLAFGAFIAWKLGVPGGIALAVTAGLVAWPAMLAIIFQLPRFRRFRDDLPISEDKGFEGAAILMTVLGLCGLLAGVGVFVMLIELPGPVLQHGPMVVVVLAVGMLVARSGMHVRAGLSGLRETSIDRSVELVNRYANFGVIAAFCCGGALLLMLMSQRLDVGGLAMVCAMVWMLMVWPVIVRRFFADRQFADLLAGPEAPLHRRAPDAGATALGWLLFAYAIYSASFAIPALAMPAADRANGGVESLVALLSSSGATHLAWLSLPVIALQAWAGFDLVRATKSARSLATLYGVVAAAFALYTQWPLISALGHGSDAGMGLEASTVQFMPLALSLVLPIATVLLVNRQIAPTMRARFRTPPKA
jgi:hypothetical protein